MTSPESRVTEPSAPIAPPPTGRDPWAWTIALAVLALVWAMRGAPLGEPVAEDFDFLHHALTQGVGSLLDGGGSQAFWRPIPHQLYYAALAPLLLDHPASVAVLHLALLALGSLLLYRALRPTFGGGVAAAVATFPLLAESVRTIAGWPTQFVDLGLFVGAALAVHEATRRRLPTALLALLAALLCKEVAVVLAVMLPFVPAVRPVPGRERVRWAVASGVLTLAWALVYLWVRRTAHLELPHGVERDAALLAAPIDLRVVWALGGSLKALASLPLVPGPDGRPVLGALLVLLALGLGAFAVSRPARARFARARGWIAFGLVWFTLATLSLTPIFPMWQPNRSQFGGVGLGIAATAFLGAAHPALAGVLVAGRVVMLARAPRAVASIQLEPPRRGAFMDFERLTRLQRFMRATRHALHAARPTLPRGARVAQQNLPHGLEYALGGDHALQVWYRDSTLRWVRFEAFRARPSMPVAAIVQFQPAQARPVAVVEPAAARLQLRALDELRAKRFDDVLATLDRADAIQRDTTAVVFRLTSGAWRSFAHTNAGRPERGVEEGARALSLDRTDTSVRYSLVVALAGLKRYDEADAHLDTLLALAPTDRFALDLRVQLDAARAASR